VIERRAAPEGPPGAWEYYVHYRKLNRRMDEWVETEQLDLDTVVPPEALDPNDPRAKRRRAEEEHSEEEGEGHAEFDPVMLREHEEFTKVKNVNSIELGRYEMETWYFSPLPPEFAGAKKLYFCEYDLEFFTRRDAMLRHLRKVRLQHPPGAEIYRHGGISMFEVDGKKAKQYCQVRVRGVGAGAGVLAAAGDGVVYSFVYLFLLFTNSKFYSKSQLPKPPRRRPLHPLPKQNLCYLAKLFLDHKTLYFDVDFFLFYVMCECDERGAHIVGYFSKEKASEEGYNLACILTFPAYQRRGYGKFLISFSYELSKIEGRVGTPERPLSDLGAVSYRGYWTRQLLAILRLREGAVSIRELSDETMIKPEDIVSTLTHLGMIQYVKGQHVIAAAPHVVAAHLAKCGGPGLEVDATKIVWVQHEPPGARGGGG
jgi:histone acetyltransferase MYST1